MTITEFILGSLGFMQLSEPQVSELISIFRSCVEGFGDAMRALWITLSPVLLAYLAWKQAINRKALDDNTEVSKKAFDVANSHNDKIARLTEIAIAKPQKVEVINTQVE